MMLVTVLAILVTNILYLLTLAFGTNIQKMSPRSYICRQHSKIVTNCKSPTSQCHQHHHSHLYNFQCQLNSYTHGRAKRLSKSDTAGNKADSLEIAVKTPPEISIRNFLCNKNISKNFQKWARNGPEVDRTPCDSKDG